MAFTIHTVTQLGARLIANATVGNKLLIEGCALSTVQYNSFQAEQLNHIPDDAPWTTNIYLSSENNNVMARATFLRSQGATTGGNWYSMILFGRMSTDGDSVKAPLAVIVSDNEFYIPETDSSISDVSVIFNLGFRININTIEVPVETIYALNSELATLRDVAVTTHNINDPSAGDAQSIRGVKTFLNPLNPALGLFWPSVNIGKEVSAVSQQTTAGSGRYTHHVFKMTNETDDITRGLKCVFYSGTGRMILSSDVDRVELPTLSLAPEYDSPSIDLSMGQIVMIALIPYSPNRGRNTGEIVGGPYDTDPEYYIRPAKWDSASGSWDYSTSDNWTLNKFKLMNGFTEPDPGNGEVAFALAQCVELND